MQRVRVTAHAFAESSDLRNARPDLVGMVLDGLGFSYYQYEHDRQLAIHYLRKSTRLLLLANESLTSEVDLPAFEAKQALICSFLTVVFSDIGSCFESFAEDKEGREAASLFRKARSEYLKSNSFSKLSPWLLYRAISAYGIAGTLSREADLQMEIRKKRSLLKKAIDYGESAHASMSFWSEYEAGLTGGCANALFHHKLANCISSEVAKRREMEESINLVSLAEKQLRGSNRSRYSNANIGDLYFRGAEYYYATSSKNTERSYPKNLRIALRNCLDSQKHFDGERHSMRAYESYMLGPASVMN